MHRILIANRGEIARRVIRTARSMGIATVAIYSDADTLSLHVAEADAAIRLEGVTPRETYLDIDKVLAAAKASGADAIHPGYGFLSENPQFAARCKTEGITFIGPSSEAIEMLGSKTSARRIAIEAGVPVMPGTTEAIRSVDEAIEVAERIGYPVLLKAAAGGGGKGMRVVESADRLDESLRMARGEAQTAFNSDEVFLEKYVLRPRHVEIQIIADASGNVLVLGERECSVQRRHQKVIEESPSPALNEALRQRMFDSARQLIAATRYTNAGTLEFLLDSDGNYYFLEVNTRLQVEHPVTEMCTGVDLVELQIRVARGETLAITTEQIVRRGAAIECRISAEDVHHNFMPSTGRIRELIEPVGDNIRVDSAMYAGMTVSLYYDPMLAKVITWGSTREEAIETMLDALDGLHIAGVSTTVPFCRFVLEHPAFTSGNYSTGFVDEHWTSHEIELGDETAQLAAAAAVRASERLHERVLSGSITDPVT
ncbi:MAG: acetyl-CoA carboxylase biotin carboxylase subunit [bacterium]|nr:acetyl-CoA carboxylase biotin carboxylase subunit [Candidatus Kapabacteria bacterium]